MRLEKSQTHDLTKGTYWLRLKMEKINDLILKEEHVSHTHIFMRVSVFLVVMWTCRLPSFDINLPV